MYRKGNNKKRRQSNLIKKAEKQRKRHKEWLKNKNKNKFKFNPTGISKVLISESQKRKEPIQVPAPEIFSLIIKPEEVLNFFSVVHKYLLKKAEVALDFSNISKVTPDALVLLIAKINNAKFCNGTRIYGNKPLKPEIDEIFRQSGFYKLIRIEKTQPEQGLLHTMKNTIVDTQVAVEARKLTASKTFGNDNKIRPLYRTLIECMANTTKHAKGANYRNETWWMIVLNNRTTKITSFSFIDTGVGIFKSTKMKTLTKFAIKIGLRSNITILKDLVEGKIQSSTGLPYRGKGLPKIYKDYTNGDLHNLHIISNNVYANFKENIFVELDNPLNGTFFYWEILPSNN